MKNDDLLEFDEVTVSGYCHSEGRFFYRLQGIIASHGPMYANELKIWPHEAVGDGKLWFRLRTLRIHNHFRARFVILTTLGGCDYYER